MSTLKDRLTADMRAALKARDELTTSTLRMALAA
ncbi:GatB/YqeY domain-containing protein, partial [Micromonospora sp. CPCC 205714]